MSSWFEERRADKAADAKQRREDRAFESKLRRDERRDDRKEKREETAQRRRDRSARRQARAARREKTLTPGNVYRKGTLGLVTLSALASLPAQIIHFVTISWMLLPIGPALEGAAWVMAAGVAYADERKLAPWVRWLLRALSMGAAGFAAHINYQYGLSLAGNGLTDGQAQMVGLGLAAVTMGGPLFFEVRQWVLTLSAAATDPKRRAEEKARAKHERRRRRHHRTVADIADRLVSAAPFGTLKSEDAWTRAWAIVHGTDEPGMTPRLHAYAVRSAQALAAAQEPAPIDTKTIRQRILEHLRKPSGAPSQPLRYVLPTPPATVLGVTGKPQVVTDLPPASKTPSEKRSKGSRRRPPAHRRSKGDALPFHPLAKSQAADTARKHTAVNGHHH
ncbi:hypothetical protein AAW14_06325 [Streptomyces hygroscopicus]|uniref:hypothetical protein n=1 Tax=Streptomyces hygroscopicus TaxID=1912 RepID=UPI0022405024|nr:hypothetical protein [Streptomyces hygroscopicus]MCW7941657.1 hypothetical protein [Streptomyces hygroscopicus]